MTRALIPSGAHIILLNGSHILLLRRASSVQNWPGHWCFPGGKVDEGELFREAAIRETLEETGVTIDADMIEDEFLINARYVNGTRIYYFGLVTDWIGTPVNAEENLHDDCEWFSLDDLPDSLVPHHRIALESLKGGTHYTEYDAIN